MLKFLLKKRNAFELCWVVIDDFKTKETVDNLNVFNNTFRVDKIK